MRISGTALYIALSIALGWFLKESLPGVGVRAQANPAVRVQTVGVTGMSAGKTAKTAGAKVVGFPCAFIGANNQTRCFIATQ